MKLPVYDEQWGESFARAIRDYMNGLFEKVDEDDGNGTAEDTITGYPFCGCEECVFREEMFLATKLILEGQEQGKVWLEEVGGG